MNGAHKHGFDLFLVLLVYLLYFVKCFEFAQITKVVHHVDLLEIVLSGGLDESTIFKMVKFVRHHRFGLEVDRGNVVAVFRDVCGFQAYNEIEDLESTF